MFWRINVNDILPLAKGELSIVLIIYTCVVFYVLPVGGAYLSFGKIFGLDVFWFILANE